MAIIKIKKHIISIGKVVLKGGHINYTGTGVCHENNLNEIIKTDSRYSFEVTQSPTLPP